ncbi:MAG: galactokinase [Bryobacterales bacterium]|nr:galactokinase [Bryobacterales bacterium]
MPGASSCQSIFAPGRVNLIGEHIDYHLLPVLPVALTRGIRIQWQPRQDATISLRSRDGYPPCEFELSASIPPAPPGDWSNYVRAAAQAVAIRWGIVRGIDAEVSSDLPAASGLSSSSALLVAASLALLEANGVRAEFAELMEVLPEAEHYVGTRGGAMDHAACLAGRRGHALRIDFAPLAVEPVPLPADWALVLIDSGVRAEKSAGLRERYNRAREAGAGALRTLAFASFHEAIFATHHRGADHLEDSQARAFRHVVSEAHRVEAACLALRDCDLNGFGRLLNESHDSLRDDLGVSCAELDRLVEVARRNGATGARLTGAGFGGYVLAVLPDAEFSRFRQAMANEVDSGRPDSLMKVEAGDGAHNE